jgi:hypothetical protein
MLYKQALAFMFVFVFAFAVAGCQVKVGRVDNCGVGRVEVGKSSKRTQDRRG